MARGATSRAHPGPTVVLMHHSAADQELARQPLVRGQPAHLPRARAAQAPRAPRGARRACARSSTATCTGTTSTSSAASRTSPLQSLIENLDDDAPGRAAAAHAVARLDGSGIVVEVCGRRTGALPVRSVAHRSAYSRPSAEPTYTVPSGAIAGDENTVPPVRKVHRTSPFGPTA